MTSMITFASTSRSTARKPTCTPVRATRCEDRRVRNRPTRGWACSITNPETQEEIECRIVFLGDLCDGGQRVGIEFLTPSPHFWGLEFSDQEPSGAESSTIL